MATQIARMAHAPIVVSATQNHLDSNYVHWEMESSPTSGVQVANYARNLELPVGKYFVTLHADGETPNLIQFTLFSGDGTSLLHGIPTGVRSWATTLEVVGTNPVVRLQVTDFDQVLVVLHRI